MYSLQEHSGVSFSHHQHFILSVFLLLAIRVGMYQYFIVVFIFIFLMKNEVEYI